MKFSTRIVVALVCLAAASGGGTAYGQLADGSIGTVQVAPPPVDVSAAVTTEPRVNVNVDVHAPADGSQTANRSVGTVQVGGSGAQNARSSAGTVQAQVPGTRLGADAAPSANGGGVNPNTTVAVSIDRAAGGGQTVENSIGTVQVGGGMQTARNSLGTAQVAQPGTGAQVSLTGPLRPDMPDGLLSREVATVALSVDPAEGGPQTARNSIGTIQVGGGEQRANDSAVTGQIAVPRVDWRTTAGGPTLAATSLDVIPGVGGAQTAEDSLGTVQIGGGGNQTASDSAGTGQLAMPGLSSDAALTREPAGSSVAATVKPSGGDQLAEDSVGTVQVGGSDSQTARDSAGTGQVALPGATGSGTTGESTTVDGSVTPTGGNQAADNSIGTVQIGGGGSGTAPATPSASRPTSGVGGAATTQGAAGGSGSPPVGSTTASNDPGGTASPLGQETSNPLKTVGGTLKALPFTGAALGVLVLTALALLLLGLTLRTRTARVVA